MTPTVFVALITHPAGDGSPRHLSLHTTEAAASAALVTALREEWDNPAKGGLAYGLGPSEEWAEHRMIAEAETHGYTLAVTEQPVELSA